MKFLILSRVFAETDYYVREKAAEPYIWISIRDPEKRHASPPNDPMRKASIFLAFDDADKEGESFLGRPIQLITDQQAQQIVQFVDSWKDKVGLCIVNCEAGISRSSGTALALSMLINGHDDGIRGNQRFAPNMLVRDKIIQQGEPLAGENTPNWFRAQWDEETQDEPGRI